MKKALPALHAALPPAAPAALLAALLMTLLLLLPTAPRTAAAGEELRLATTTSLENSGLLGHLLPAFETDCHCRVHVIPVGTGKALELGRRGDVDVLLVHAPQAEQEFIAAGNGSERRPIAYNRFVLLAPPDSAVAPIADGGDILTVLAHIADQRLPFLSRGDDSGTHKKENMLWDKLRQQQALQMEMTSNWYIEAGAGMGQAILMANELNAHVLSDRGTYLHLRDKVTLRPLPLADSELLYNPYSVILLNQDRHPHIKHQLAQRFADWLQHPKTKKRIADYHLMGESLFAPF